MYNYGKCLVMLVALALLTEQGQMAQADPPSLYWHRTSQHFTNSISGCATVSEATYGEFLGWDQEEYPWGTYIDSDEDELTLDTSLLATIPGTSALSEPSINTYLNSDNQSVFECGFISNHNISGSTNSNYCSNCSSCASSEAYISTAAILSGETGINKTEQFELDINWVVTNTYPVYQGSFQWQPWIDGYVQSNGGFGYLQSDSSNEMAAEGWSHNGGYFYTTASAPQYALTGSLVLGGPDFTAPAHSGWGANAISVELCTSDWLSGYFPVVGNEDSAEATSVYQGTFTVSLIDQ